jgi:hypothetical protein
MISQLERRIARLEQLVPASVTARPSLILFAYDGYWTEHDQAMLDAFYQDYQAGDLPCLVIDFISDGFMQAVKDPVCGSLTIEGEDASLSSACRIAKRRKSVTRSVLTKSSKPLPKQSSQITAVSTLTAEEPKLCGSAHVSPIHNSKETPVPQGKTTHKPAVQSLASLELASLAADLAAFRHRPKR